MDGDSAAGGAAAVRTRPGRVMTMRAPVSDECVRDAWSRRHRCHVTVRRQLDAPRSLLSQDRGTMPKFLKVRTWNTARACRPAWLHPQQPGSGALGF